MTRMTDNSAHWPVRTGKDSDFTAYDDLSRLAFGSPLSEATSKGLKIAHDTSDVIVAHEPDNPDRLVGGSMGLPLQVSFPAGRGAALQDAHGLTWVAVRPDRQKRGVMRRLIEAQLEAARDRGCGWSVLVANSPALYAKFGYGCACCLNSMTARADLFRSVAIDDSRYAFDLVPLAEEYYGQYRSVWKQHAQRVAGTVVVDNEMYHAYHCQTERDLAASPKHQIVLLHRDRQLVATGLLFRQQSTSAPNRLSGHLMGFFSIDDEARIMLARQVCNIDLMDSVTISGIADDDPLIWAAQGPRDLNLSVRDGLWLRPIYLDKALSQLHWGTSLRLTLAISDPVPGTVETVAIAADGSGTAQITPTDAPADLTVPSILLGALSLGGLTPQGATRRAPVTETRPGALHDLAVALRSDHAPTMSVGV